MYRVKKTKLLSIACFLALIISMPMAIFSQVSNPEIVDPERRCEGCAELTLEEQQETTEGKAQLRGVIFNVDKKLISNAKVQLEHKGSGEVFNGMSNELGEFASPALPPGKHIVLVEKEGYMSFKMEVELQPNIVQTLEITMAPQEPIDQKQEKEAYKSFENGVTLAKEGKPDDAARAFHKAIELKPDFGEACLNLGILLFQQQKDNEAEEALLKALEFKSDDPKVKQVLADVNFEQAKVQIRVKNVDKALEKLEQSYSFRQDHALVNYLMGYLYYKKQMNDEAVKHLEAFIQLAPEASQVETANKILKSLEENSKGLEQQ